MRVLNKEDVLSRLNTNLTYQENDIILDSEDISSFSENRDFFVVSETCISDKNMALSSLTKIVVNDITKNGYELNGASSILVHFELSEDYIYRLNSITEAMEIVHESSVTLDIRQETDVLFGVSFGSKLKDIKVTLYVAYIKSQ